MIFTDGAADSLTGIFALLSEFTKISGLLINPAKTSIFMAGRIGKAFKDEVHRLGIPIDTSGALPGAPSYHKDNDSC